MHPDQMTLPRWFFFTIMCKLARRFDFACSAIHVTIIRIYRWLDIMSVHGAKLFYAVMTNNLLR